MTIIIMQVYSRLNGILLNRQSTYHEFQERLVASKVEQETYLNLFLMTVAWHHSQDQNFDKYLELLTHYKDYTGKKSASVNYICYKERKSILMITCLRGNPQSLESLLKYKVEPEVTDPQGKTAVFYALRNINQQYANQILSLLLNRFPQLIHKQTLQGHTLLHEAVDTLRISTIDLLLRKGANPNHKLRVNGDTVSHQILRQKKCSSQVVHSVLAILVKYKANFEQTNNQGLSVYQTALQEGINFQDYNSFCELLQKESTYEDNDVSFDKISLTTLNQQSKVGDTASDINENQPSARVDFSQFDEPYLKDQQEDWSNFSDQQSSQQIQSIDYNLLSQEIVEFGNEYRRIYAGHLEKASHFIQILAKISADYGLMLQCVGSFATELWTTRSDIDISLTPMHNQFINFETTLQRIYKVLKLGKRQLNIEDIYFVKGKIWSIRVVVEKILYDVSIFHRNHPNKDYTYYIKNALNIYPCIVDLFFILKHLLQLFQLHDPHSGGIKTYALFIMIYRIVSSIPASNLGQLFKHIVENYGFNFQYTYEDHGESNKEDSPAVRFNLPDPLNSKNNLGGKNTKAERLQNMFRVIYCRLIQPINPPYISQLLQLHQLI